MKTEQACEFALDIQEMTSGVTDIVPVITECVQKHKNLIDHENCNGQMIAFTDGSTATLEGHNWVLGHL